MLIGQTLRRRSLRRPRHVHGQHLRKSSWKCPSGFDLNTPLESFLPSNTQTQYSCSESGTWSTLNFVLFNRASLSSGWTEISITQILTHGMGLQGLFLISRTCSPFKFFSFKYEKSFETRLDIHFFNFVLYFGLLWHLKPLFSFISKFLIFLQLTQFNINIICTFSYQSKNICFRLTKRHLALRIWSASSKQRITLFAGKFHKNYVRL